MRELLLLLAVIVGPFVWGWLAYRIVAWLWPVAEQQRGSEREPRQLDTDYLDYQI